MAKGQFGRGMGRPQTPVDLTKLVTLGDVDYLAKFAEAIVQLVSVEGKKDVRRIVDLLGEFGYQAHNAREGLRAVGAFYRELQASGGVLAKLVYRPPQGEKTIKVPGQSPPVEEEAPKASKASKAPKSPKAPKAPSAPKAPAAPKAPTGSRGIDYSVDEPEPQPLWKSIRRQPRINPQRNWRLVGTAVESWVTGSLRLRTKQGTAEELGWSSSTRRLYARQRERTFVPYFYAKDIRSAELRELEAAVPAMLGEAAQIITEDFAQTWATWWHTPDVEVVVGAGRDGAIGLTVKVSGPRVERPGIGGTVENLYQLISDGAPGHLILPSRQTTRRGGQLFIGAHRDGGFVPKTRVGTLKSGPGNPGIEGRWLSTSTGVWHPGFEGRNYDDLVYEHAARRVRGLIRRKAHRMVRNLA